MMQWWGYDLEEKPGLNYGKGVRALPLPFVPEGKDANYYQEAKRALGYLSPPPRSHHGPLCEWSPMIILRICLVGNLMPALEPSSKDCPLTWCQQVLWKI